MTWSAVVDVSTPIRTCRPDYWLRSGPCPGRGDRPPLDLGGRTVVLVDDGLATGATMREDVEAVRRLGPARVVVAVPVGAPETCAAFADLADEAVCAIGPYPFFTVGSSRVDLQACKLEYSIVSPK